MKKVLMIGEPLFLKKKKKHYCEHKKLPKVIQLHKNRAIRLNDMSRLRKLGEDVSYHAGFETNEFSCGCLWSMHGYIPPPKSERIESKLEFKAVQPSREHQTCKPKSVRTQIMNRFRATLYSKRKAYKNDESLHASNSVVWLMRPLTEMRLSKTNIPQADKWTNATTKLNQSVQKINLSKKFVMSQDKSPNSKQTEKSACNAKTQQNRHICIDTQLETKKPMQKGTKDYYNEYKKILANKLLEKEQEVKNLDQRKHNPKHSYAEMLHPPHDKRHDFKKNNELKNFESKFEQQQSITKLTQRLNSKECIHEIIATNSKNSEVEQADKERSIKKCNCDLCRCRTKPSNIGSAALQEKNIKPCGISQSSPSSLGHNTTTHTSSSNRNICDYMWLKSVDTQIEFSSNNKTVEETSNQTTTSSKLMMKSENESRTSMKVNFSGSTTRMTDFESSIGADEQSSELAKEKVFSPKEGDFTQLEGLQKELRHQGDEKELASAIKIDGANENSVAATTKTKKIAAKKHKQRKLKKKRNKKQKPEPLIETLKSIENIENDNKEMDHLLSPDESLISSTDDSIHLASLKFADGTFSYIELQGSTRQNIRNESFNIFYHKPIKYERKRNTDVYSSSYDDLL